LPDDLYSEAVHSSPSRLTGSMAVAPDFSGVMVCLDVESDSLARPRPSAQSGRSF